VKELPGVKDAKVNFFASKITVFGDKEIEELEKAGSFENLKVFSEGQQMNKESLWKNKEMLQTVASGLLLILGWILHFQVGADSLPTLLAYGSSIVVGGYTLFFRGLGNLLRFRFDMKTLMTVAVLGAAAIGEWGEGATVVFLFAISEVLEGYSMDKARQSIRSLINIAPKEAIVRRGDEELQIPVEQIEIGDIMLVKPGQKLAMDGNVVKGASTINQAAITGESMPASKSTGDEVFAGTLNEVGFLEIEVTKRVEDTTIAKIIHLVEEAQAERAPSQAFIDRFAKYYTPAIMLIALGVAIIPPLVFNGVWNEWIYRALAVLVVGCPCALVISTPVAIVTAIGNAARNGVLIKGGIYLEEAGALSAVAFDKTGTLTRGVPEVTDIIRFSDHEVVGLAAAIEKGSQHPLASAIVRRAKEEELDTSAWQVDDFFSLTGKGVKASVNESIYYIGSPSLFQELMPDKLSKDTNEQITNLQKQGKTVVVLGTEQHILGLIAIADQIRESSRGVIQKLHELGIKSTMMLTGDNKETAKAVGQQVGVSTVKAELLPQEKLKVIKEIKQNNTKIAMVGDGVNDAPALATATVGIAMGGAGTDTALETADIALMADDLTKLPFTIKLSRKSLQVIKQNILFAIGLKVLALLLIIPGLLTLWLAIFADMGATLLVTLNSLRLLRIKP
jgi:Cd2+/Zn2+-exporting ATPase